MRRPWLLLACLAVSSCKQRQTDHLPAEDPELTTDDLLREQARVQAGQVVGKALREPKITLDSRGVAVNGRLVVPPGELEPAKLARIDKLFSVLKRLREHWRMIHPGEDFHGIADLTIDPQMTAFTAASVVTSTAFSGFRGVRLHAGSSTLETAFWLPGPPRAEGSVGPPQVRLKLRRGAVGEEVAVFRSGSCDPQVAAVQVRVEQSESLGALIGELCVDGAQCHVSVEASAGSFASVMDTLVSAMVPRANVYLNFSSPSDPDDPSGHGWFVRLSPFYREGQGRLGDPDAPAPAPLEPLMAPVGKQSKAPRVSLGLSTISGRLHPDAVDESIRAGLERFAGCYRAGLARNPNLTGRVAVRLSVDMNGAVAESCNGGADLPDASVVQCVVREAKRLKFPPPESRSVTLVSPLTFSVP